MLFLNERTISKRIAKIKKLDLENVDELVKSILLLNNNLKSNVSEGKLLPNNNLKCYISEGSYIIDLHLIDD